MKKAIFITLVLIAGKLFANPVIPPPVTSEFYYNEGNWQLELYFPSEFYLDFNGFSDFRLVCDADTAYFHNGTYFACDTILVIDQNSITSQFNINPLADHIYLTFYDFYRLDNGILYKEPWNFASGYVTSPGPGESIVRQHFYTGWDDDFYRLMKDNSPSIGTDAFNCNSRGTFTGNVYDQNGNPVPDIKFTYCPEHFCYGYTNPDFQCFKTDENGYFEADELFCKWHIFRLEKDSIVFTTDTIFFEPDSVYYKEYSLTDVGISLLNFNKEFEIKVYPNPFHRKTTFSLDIPEESKWIKGRILIRNINGQLIDFIPLIANPWAGGEVKVDWIPDHAPYDIGPGLYIYTLEFDGRPVKSEKLIIYE